MLTKEREEIVNEVMNIAIGSAASALSKLVMARVSVEVPELRLIKASDVSTYLKNELDVLSVYISQAFQGEIEGKSLLCYSQEAVQALLDISFGKRTDLQFISNFEKGALQETSNIILTSLISAISNLIKYRIRFEVPHVAFDGHKGYFEYLTRDILEFEYAIVIKTQMVVKERDISGYVFILLGLKDIESIIERLEENNLE